MCQDLNLNFSISKKEYEDGPHRKLKQGVTVTRYRSICCLFWIGNVNVKEK